MIWQLKLCSLMNTQIRFKGEKVMNNQTQGKKENAMAVIQALATKFQGTFSCEDKTEGTNARYMPISDNQDEGANCLRSETETMLTTDFWSWPVPRLEVR